MPGIEALLRLPSNALITRCTGENDWRWISIRDPKKVLNEKFPIDPVRTDSPWEVLQTELLTSPDNLTQDVLDVLDKSFFQKNFRTGLMILIEEFPVDNYDQYFSITRSSPSYLREYIRFYTAHADIRRISNKTFGFRTSEVNQLKKHVKPTEPATLHLWTSAENEDPSFDSIPVGGRTCQYRGRKGRRRATHSRPRRFHDCGTGRSLPVTRTASSMRAGTIQTNSGAIDGKAASP